MTDQGITIKFTPSEIKEFRAVLDRAMRTWDPNAWPAWLDELSKLVDKELGIFVP